MKKLIACNVIFGSSTSNVLKTVVSRIVIDFFNDNVIRFLEALTTEGFIEHVKDLFLTYKYIKLKL